jgi:hypothetical protein
LLVALNVLIRQLSSRFENTFVTNLLIPRTVSEEDLNPIKRSVQNLSQNQNQKQITHVLEENISILNVTRIQVAENGKSLYELLTSHFLEWFLL